MMVFLHVLDALPRFGPVGRILVLVAWRRSQCFAVHYDSVPGGLTRNMLLGSAAVVKVLSGHADDVDFQFRRVFLQVTPERRILHLTWSSVGCYLRQLPRGRRPSVPGAARWPASRTDDRSRSYLFLDGPGDVQGVLVRSSGSHRWACYPCAWRACHTFSGVRGVSMWRTPTLERASMTALATATGRPM